MPAKKKATTTPKLAKPTTPAFALGGGDGFALGKGADTRPVAGTHTGKRDDPALPVETEADAENADLKAAFYGAKAANQQRLALHTGAAYYAVLVFANGPDCEAFLNALPEHVLTFDDTFIDGYDIAKLLKIKLDPSPLPEPNGGPIARWMKFGMLPADPPAE